MGLLHPLACERAMTKGRPIAAIAMLAIFAMGPLLITSVGAQQLSDRAKQIGGKFMCMCGCSQALTECTPVGCRTSAGTVTEFNQPLSRGTSEDAITRMFGQ